MPQPTTFASLEDEVKELFSLLSAQGLAKLNHDTHRGVPLAW